jgi:hypothetical protein
MTDTTTIVAGIEVPSISPVFLTVVGFHVIAGIACVIAGMIAMLSKKRRGRHPTFGTIYYWCLAAVFASATALAAVRWAEDYTCSFLGCFPSALHFGRRLAGNVGAAGSNSTSPAWLSYIFPLTAFWTTDTACRFGKNFLRSPIGYCPACSGYRSLCTTRSWHGSRAVCGLIS